MADKLGFTVTIDGNTTPLNDSLKSVNKQLNETQKELKSVDRLSKFNPRNLGLYIEKQKILRKSVEETKDKLKILKKAQKEVENQFASGKIDASQYNAFRQEIAKTEQSLKSLKNQTVSIKGVISNMGNAALSGGKALASGMVSVLSSSATVATSATTAIVGLTVKAGEQADEINTLAKVTGLSTEQIQKYQYAAESVDVSFDTISGSLTKLTNNMDNARKGSGDSAKAFEKLGVAVTDSNGQLRDNDEVFKEVLDQLAKVENATERDALAMDIFGRSAQELNPLILGGAEQLENLGKKAEDAGLILSQDMLDNLNDVADASDELKSTMKSAGMIIGNVFAKDVAKAMNAINDFVQNLTKAYKEGGIEAVAEVAQQGLNDLILYINENLPQFLDMGMNLIMSLVQGIVNNSDVIIETIINVVFWMIDTFIENLPQIIDMGITVLTNLAQGLIDAIPRLVERIPEIIASIVTGFTENMPDILGIGVAIVEGVWEGIKSMGQWLSDQVTGFFDGIVGGVKDFFGIHSPSTLFRDEIGKNMAAGVGVGFSQEFKNVDRMIKGSISNTATFNQTYNINGYSNRDGMKISRSINRQLGLAYGV